GEVAKLGVGRRVKAPNDAAFRGVEEGLLIGREVDPVGAARTNSYSKGRQKHASRIELPDDAATGPTHIEIAGTVEDNRLVICGVVARDKVGALKNPVVVELRESA